MDYDGNIQQLIPAHRPDMWVKSFCDDGAYFENIAAFALARDKFGNLEILTLTVDGSGRLYEPDGCMMIFSKENPNVPDSDETEGGENDDSGTA